MADPQRISVVISSSVDPGGTMKVLLDGNALVFSGGQVTVPVSPGEHSLMWFVVGSAGIAYTLSIAVPASVGFHTGAKLNGTGSDHGTTWFSV